MYLFIFVLSTGSGDDACSEERHVDLVGPIRPHPTALSTNYQYTCVGGGLQQWEVSQSQSILGPIHPDTAVENVGFSDVDSRKKSALTRSALTVYM